MKKYILLSLIILFSINESLAQNPSPVSTCCNMQHETTVVFDTITTVIHGQVTESNSGKPLKDVTVVLLDLNGNQISKKSDLHGKFTFFHIQDQEYAIYIHKKEYCSIRKEKLKFGGGVEMTICLKRN